MLVPEDWTHTTVGIIGAVPFGRLFNARAEMQDPTFKWSGGLTERNGMLIGPAFMSGQRQRNRYAQSEIKADWNSTDRLLYS